MQVEFDNVGVVDDFLSMEEVTGLYHFFLNKRYKIDHTSLDTHQPSVCKQNAYYLDGKDLENPVVAKVIKGIDRPFIRAYVQAYNPSTIPFIHRDIGGYTSLTFFHPKYDPSWGGDTILYDDRGIGMAIQPTPGRLLSFPGATMDHVGRPFNSLASVFRFILIINYE